MAELGPYILGYKGWKIRVYRALFNAVQRYWTAERFIRVTDSVGMAQFIQINGTGIDPRTGMPAVVNAIGELDVDIIMDEGQDTINAQQDVYETLSQIIPSIAPMLKPAEASAAVSILVESSSLSATAKKQWRDATQQQPDPMAQQAKQIALQGEAAKVGETQSKTQLNMAKAQSEGMPQGTTHGHAVADPGSHGQGGGGHQRDQCDGDAQAGAGEQAADGIAVGAACGGARRGDAAGELGLDAHMQAAKLGLDAHNAEQDRISRMKALNRRNGND